jgi:hypothetical protein
MYESQINRVSQLIHDLHEEIDEVRKQNVGLRNANEIYSKQNIDLRKNQDQDDLNRQITELKKDNNLLKEAFKDVKKDNNIFKKDNHNAHMLINDLKKENVELKSNMELGVDWEYDNDGNHVAYSKDDLNRQITKLKKDIHYYRQENVRLVGQLENDEHNVGHLDEKMKRLDYLEKHVAENRYVFSEIPNTPENMKMVKMMKKYINKRKYTMRWRGQYLIDGQDWRKYTHGQPLSKSKCIRVYIDNKPCQIDNVEGFKANEVEVIMDSLDKQIDANEEFIRTWDYNGGEVNEEVDQEKRELNIAKELYSYFESMKLHLENSASTPIKDNVNIVIPKGDK